MMHFVFTSTTVIIILQLLCISFMHMHGLVTFDDFLVLHFYANKIKINVFIVVRTMDMSIYKSPDGSDGQVKIQKCIICISGI